MPPMIEVSDEVLEGLNKLKISYSKVGNSNLDKDFPYIPSSNLHFAKQKTLQGKNWHETHKSLSNEGLLMPSPLEFAQTLKYLRDNPNQENTELYNEMTKVRSPWRATWLNAFFEKRSDGLYILTENGIKVQKLDEDTLMENQGISLDSWIENPTSQGLPRRNVAKGNLNFYPSINNSVAGFLADDGGAGLDCGRSLGSWNSLIWRRWRRLTRYFHSHSDLRKPRLNLWKEPEQSD